MDVELTEDRPLYIDPYALQIRNDSWSSECTLLVRNFFNELLDALRAKNEVRAAHLMANLHEPNETRFGVSKDEPQGRAIGQKKAEEIVDAMRRSRAFETGLLSDVSEAELFVAGIGPDTISDLVTNVIRSRLCEYTSEQCKIHNIPTQTVTSLGPVWNPKAGDWEAVEHQLPLFNRKPLVLVPKFSVRRGLALNSQEFYNHHMIDFLQAEYLRTSSGLVRTFKDGTPYVTKKTVKERHPFIKDDLADFVRKHPEVLEKYKALKGADGSLSDFDFARIIEETYFDERVFARALIDGLADITAGPKEASRYHSYIMGILTFLLYPSLSEPIKELEIHEGRKRIDIRYTNTSKGGFFHRMLMHAGARSIYVPVEVKNYTREIANPELDQISGRFSPHRGRLGFVLCRNLDNRKAFIQRCRDTALDDRGYVIVLTDEDVNLMLDLVQGGQRSRVDEYLGARFDEIV